MEIKKEEFYKLKQLDRIEYRQRYNCIRDDLSCGFWSFNWCVLIIYIISVSSAFIVNEITGNVDDLLFTVINSTSTLLGFSFTINIFLIIIFHILKVKNIKELDNEYFKVEVKK